MVKSNANYLSYVVICLLHHGFLLVGLYQSLRPTRKAMMLEKNGNNFDLLFRTFKYLGGTCFINDLKVLNSNSNDNQLILAV